MLPDVCRLRRLGTVGAPKFERAQLNETKTSCEKQCFSTLNHIVYYCYNDRRVIQWLLAQRRHGFQGVNGNQRRIA